MKRFLHRMPVPPLLPFLLAPLFIILLLSGNASAGPWHAAHGNTSGWKLMSPEERIEHQRRMRSFDDYASCKAYQAEHHAQMQQRAMRAGVQIRPAPHGGCEQLLRRGRLR